jgi:hypothetical protein
LSKLRVWSKLALHMAGMTAQVPQADIADICKLRSLYHLAFGVRQGGM